MPFWLTSKRKPLIVAHRGSSAVTPENTLASFHQAIEDGADALELDVHLTKDGEVVVIHDSTLNRTTNGRGRVREYTLAELKQLDAGSWFQKFFSSEKIPTLAEVFKLFHGKIGINVEIKAERMHHQQLDVVDKCCKLITEYEMEEFILVSSFHQKFIDQVKLHHPNIAIGLLYDPIQPFVNSKILHAKAVHAEYIILNGRDLRNKIIEDIRTAGLLIGEYTINTQHRFNRALRFGVDAVITNNPARIKNYLEDRNKNPPCGG